MPEVSVLIPLFGAHQGRATLEAVCAGWLAQDVRCEVVVGFAGEPPRLPADRRLRMVSADPATRSAGPLRNLAATQANGDWLYLSDADVRPLGTGYLSRALALAGQSALAQPWQYRLTGEDMLAVGADRDGWWRTLAGQRCCFLRGDRTSPIVPYPGERFVADGDDLLVVPPPGLLDCCGTTELRWRAPYHWGGLLIRRPWFAAVGGYSAGYVGWGCEDDDLLIKARSKGPVTIAWRADPTLRCLHYEHPRPYHTAEFEANEALLARRLADGPAAMIEADRSATGSMPDRAPAPLRTG